MVKNLFTFFFICLLFLAKQSNANENNPILNIENKLIIEKYFDEINLIGEANYSFLFWDLYDAQLYSESKIFDKNRSALILRYNKKITKDRLVEETIGDMKDQKKLSKTQIENWTKVFSNIYKTVQVGERFLAIRIANNKSIFFFNEKKIYESSDKDFLNLFFNIWLRNDSKNPDFSKKLIGGS